jgi:hypothetical protein
MHSSRSHLERLYNSIVHWFYMVCITMRLAERKNEVSHIKLDCLVTISRLIIAHKCSEGWQDITSCWLVAIFIDSTDFGIPQKKTTIPQFIHIPQVRKLLKFNCWCEEEKGWKWK